MDLFGVAEKKTANVEVGSRLRLARERMGLSVRGLEARSGVNNGNLSRIENGKGGLPTGAAFVRLAASLGVTTEWLAEGHGPMLATHVDAPAPAVSAADFVRWYFGGGTIAEVATKHPDVTVADLLALHQVMPRHGETDAEAIYRLIQQNRRGAVAGVEVEPEDAEKRMRAVRAKARKA